MSQEFYETDRSRGFVRGYSFEIMRGFGPVSTALWAMNTGRLPWGADHHRAYGDLFNRTAGILAICEDLPDPANTVRLDPVSLTRTASPARRSRTSSARTARRCSRTPWPARRRCWRRLAPGNTMVESPLALAGWHLMGTARMGTDPRTSVVNEWGRCHDVRNLFIIDGSIFVTAAGVNPTNTIQALASTSAT